MIILRTSFEDSHLNLFDSIDMYSDHIGTVYIRADRHELHERIESYGAIVGGILVVSLLFIVVISFILQKLVSVPILAASALGWGPSTRW